MAALAWAFDNDAMTATENVFLRWPNPAMTAFFALLPVYALELLSIVVFAAKVFEGWYLHGASERDCTEAKSISSLVVRIFAFGAVVVNCLEPTMTMIQHPNRSLGWLSGVCGHGKRFKRSGVVD
jgi:hypothetical protein